MTAVSIFAVDPFCNDRIPIDPAHCLEADPDCEELPANPDQCVGVQSYHEAPFSHDWQEATHRYAYERVNAVKKPCTCKYKCKFVEDEMTCVKGAVNRVPSRSGNGIINDCELKFEWGEKTCVPRGGS
jgi:hypothetical protein